MTDCSPTRCRCPYTHDEWQRQVVELAHTLGWQHLHVRRTRGKGGRWTTSTNREGWPDLFLWHPRHGFAAVELKTAGDGRNAADVARREQQAQVLVELHAAGAAVLMAWPHDLDVVVALLRGVLEVPT